MRTTSRVATGVLLAALLGSAAGCGDDGAPTGAGGSAASTTLTDGSKSTTGGADGSGDEDGDVGGSNGAKGGDPRTGAGPGAAGAGGRSTSTTAAGRPFRAPEHRNERSTIPLDSDMPACVEHGATLDVRVRTAAGVTVAMTFKPATEATTGLDRSSGKAGADGVYTWEGLGVTPNDGVGQGTLLVSATASTGSDGASGTFPVTIAAAGGCPPATAG